MDGIELAPPEPEPEPEVEEEAGAPTVLLAPPTMPAPAPELAAVLPVADMS